MMQVREQRKKKIFYGVDVIDTADEGLAIGRCEDGLIIQIRGAVPGDKVDAVVIEKRKGMFITKVMDIHSFSPDRVDPFCIHFGTCGGCKWQHMSYEAQLRYKEKKVRDAYRRIGELDDHLVKPIVGGSIQTYYRNKLEYTASDRRWLTEVEMHGGHEIEERDGVGFHLPGAFDKVLDVVHCYLQPEPSNDIRQFIKRICRENNWPFANLKYKTGYLRNIIVRNNLAGDVMIVVVVGDPDSEKMNTIVS